MTPELQRRFGECTRAWAMQVEETRETQTSVLAFGTRGAEAVVAKVIKAVDDEWHAGGVVAAFGGAGMVRALDYREGAMLLERLEPGHSLAPTALEGGDDEATGILAGLIGELRPAAPPAGTPTLHLRAEAFGWYAASADMPIDPALVAHAGAEFAALLRSQRETRLLHGDLHHYNVLRDAKRGWLAIDPKGLVGELEYEVGAALRNPCVRPELLADPHTIERRVTRFARELALDRGRILRWAFAQAILAAIWEVQEGMPLAPGNAWTALAEAVRQMLREGVC